jgi:hypothetical protein
VDAGLYVIGSQPVLCNDPNPLLEGARDPGDREHGRKFLTDLCVWAARLPPECPA